MLQIHIQVLFVYIYSRFMNIQIINNVSTMRALQLCMCFTFFDSSKRSRYLRKMLWPRLKNNFLLQVHLPTGNTPESHRRGIPIQRTIYHTVYTVYYCNIIQVHTLTTSRRPHVQRVRVCRIYYIIGEDGWIENKTRQTHNLERAHLLRKDRTSLRFVYNAVILYCGAL